jgi:cobalt/nickel transport system permease protein
MIPYLGIAARKVSKVLRSRHVPLLALGAAFSFVIMMFNVPIPGGTTGHAVGGVIVAVILGPWAASIAVSIALIVQALLFGDGGITAIGANCFNMGVVIPFVGYYIYKLISGSSEITSSRRWVAGAIGGYVGINVAAVIAGIEFGIQPLIATAPDGHPLYAPYPLSVAVPAMAIEHLILFGIVEALVTALIIIYLQKSDKTLLTIYGGAR